MVEVTRKKKPNMEKQASFSDKKPFSEGPAKVLNEKWLLRELKCLGWDEKTIKGIMNIKKKLFKDEHLFPAAFGQTDSVNMEKKVNGLKMSVHINAWYVIVYLNSVSDKKRDKTADGIKSIFKNNLPKIAFSAKRNKDQRGYVVILAGAYNKPDGLCEGGKNICKTTSPPYIPEFRSPSVITQQNSVRGC